MGKFIDNMMESVGNNAGAGIAGALLGPIGNQIGYGLGELTGYNKALERDQLRQQQALTNIQSDANLSLMKESYLQQKQLWDNTSAEAQVSHLKNAGLNPALMYAKGGTGGSTGGGGASVSGAQASDTTSRQMASNAQNMTGLAMMKAQSEIAVNNSIAAKNNADAQTTNENRENVVELTKQQGRGEWIENTKQKLLLTMNKESDAVEAWKAVNPVTKEEIERGDIFTSKATADLLLTLSQSANAEASAALNSEKANYYFKTILNDTARANASGVQAAAAKLAADFQFGDLYNTKFWIQLGDKIVNDVIKGAGAIKPGVRNTYNTTKNATIFNP